MSRKFEFYSNLEIIKGALHEDHYPFLTVSRLILLRMRNVSDKVVGEIKTHIVYLGNFFNP